MNGQAQLSLKAGVKGRVQDGRVPHIVHERARADLGGILVGAALPQLLYPELAYAARTAAATHNKTEALTIREFLRLMELKVFFCDKDADEYDISHTMML